MPARLSVGDDLPGERKMFEVGFGDSGLSVALLI